MSNSEILKLVNKNEWDKAIKKLRNINDVIHNDFRLIHYAVIQNDIKLFDKLIKKKAKLNLTNIHSNTIAHLAANNGYTELFKKIINLEPKIIYNKNDNLDTPLHLVTDNYELIKFLFNLKKKLNWKYLFKQINNRKDSALNNALDNGNYKILKLFFNHPECIWDFPSDKYPLFQMVKSDRLTNNQKIILLKDFVKNDGDINMIDIRGDMILLFIISDNNFELFKTAVELGADVNYMSAISTYDILREAYTVGMANNDLRIFNYAIKQKNINYRKRDKYFDTIGHFILLFRIYKDQKNLKLEKKILKNIDDFNSPNIDGNNILHLITSLNWKDYKVILKNKDLDIFVKNHDGNSSLDMVGLENRDKFLEFIASNYLKLNKEKISQKSIDKTIKKILKSKNSLVKNNKDVKINLANNYSYAYYSNYEASFRDVLIYSIYILNKYQNKLTIPIKDTIILDNLDIDLKLTTDIKLQTMDIYQPEIIDYFIFWEDIDNNYFSDNLISLINKKINGKKNIFLYLSLSSDRMLHANIIYIDLKNKTIERFDPYGNITLGNSDENLDKFLKTKFEPIKDFEYIGTKYMGISSFQTISREDDIHKKKYGDIGGFCLAWCMWYIELRLNNPKINSKDLVEKTIKKIIKKKINFTDFIRNYANNLNTYLRKFLKKAGIKEKHVYNEFYSKQEYSNIKKLIYSEFKKIK